MFFNHLMTKQSKGVESETLRAVGRPTMASPIRGKIGQSHLKEVLEKRNKCIPCLVRCQTFRKESFPYMGYSSSSRTDSCLSLFYFLLAFCLSKSKAGRGLILGSQNHWSSNDRIWLAERNLKGYEVKQMPKSNPSSSQIQKQDSKHGCLTLSP